MNTPKTEHTQRADESERARETESRSHHSPAGEAGGEKRSEKSSQGAEKHAEKKSDAASAEKKPDAAAEKRSDSAKSSAVKPKARGKNNVRMLRMERMMSKAELARRAGLSTLTIDRVERGMACRMDTKRKILEALGLTPSDRVTVFGDDD